MTTDAAPLHETQLALGTTAGGWRIERAIGEGGMGIVYEAVRSSDGRRAAVKVIHRALANDAVARKRFEREARTTRAVRHAHIVEILESGALDDGRPYFVMPLLAGDTLAHALAATRRSWSPREVWRVLRPIADALDAAHAAGVVHRDVKPANIFLCANERGDPVPRLLDFGIARMNAGDTVITRTGAPIGTAQYMSPEQWWNQSVGPATDQYALGVIAFELLAGRLPFDGSAFVDLMQRHLNAVPPPLRSLGVAVSPDIEAWVARALAKSIGDRFPSMREMILAGDAVFGAATPRRQWRALRVSLVVAAVLAQMVAIGYAGDHSPKQWFRIAGFPAFIEVAAAIAGAIMVALGRRSAAYALALGCMELGVFGAWTGWIATSRGVAHLAAERRFGIFNEGIAESEANMFMVGGSACAILVAILWLDATRVRAAREQFIAAAGFLTLAIAAALVGAQAGAMLCATVACIHFVPAGPSRARREEIGAASVRLAALACIAVAALAHTDARAAAAWENPPTRAARMEELGLAASERTGLLALLAVCIIASVGYAAMRVARAPQGTFAWSSSPRVYALGAGVLSFFVADAAFRAGVDAQRASLWNELAPQFALFAQLDPPTSVGLPAPRLAVTLQFARDVVAIDGNRVALPAALDNATGESALALDLSHRLASRGRAADAPDLAISADRTTPWKRIVHALEVAHQVGVERVEFLFTRGPAPRIRANSPPEAAFAIPRDFGALDATLADGAGARFADDDTFERVAGNLRSRVGHGERVVLDAAR